MAMCALCLEDRKLCNSHIVPDFIFKKLKKDAGIFYVVERDAPAREFGRTFTEKLLCERCERKFSAWETYAKKFFHGGMTLESVHQGRRQIKLNGLQYAPMKLFYMSLLWRLGVTTCPWLRGATLGRHSERLRRRLLATDPAEPWRYGCSVIAVLVNGRPIPDLIVPLSPVQMDGHTVQRAIVGGFLLAYNVTSHAPLGLGNSLVLQTDGSFVLGFAEIDRLAYLKPSLRSLIQQEFADPSKRSAGGPQERR